LPDHGPLGFQNSYPFTLLLLFHLEIKKKKKTMPAVKATPHIN